MATHRLRIRYARFEEGKLVRYQPGSEIVLTPEEYAALRPSVDPVDSLPLRPDDLDTGDTDPDLPPQSELDEVDDLLDEV